MKKTNYIFVCMLAGICLFGAILLSACGSSPVAKEGDTVQVDYILTLSDGTLHETSVGNEPLEFVIGAGQVLPDFEEAVIGMKPGESKIITIPAADAYGEYREDFIITLGKDQIAEGTDPKVGDKLYTQDEAGNLWTLVVISVSDTTVTVDANLPLAGEDLTFEIKLLTIN